MTLFFGALNREQDWLPFMPAINAVARMAGKRLKFQIVHDRTFFDALETRHKTSRQPAIIKPICNCLAESEISFMPLSDTPFNRAKSDLKFIEAGACRVAALASSVVYGDSIQDGKNGLLFRDATELHAGLLRLVAMPELAKDLADAARRTSRPTHAGLSGVAADRLVPVALGPKGGAEASARMQEWRRFHGMA